MNTAFGTRQERYQGATGAEAAYSQILVQWLRVQSLAVTEGNIKHKSLSLTKDALIDLLHQKKLTCQF